MGLATDQPFYHLGGHLYLVETPIFKIARQGQAFHPDGEIEVTWFEGKASDFHPNRARPIRFENKFVFNWRVRAGRYLSSVATSQLPSAVSVAHQKTARSVEQSWLSRARSDNGGLKSEGLKSKWIRPSKQSQRLT